MRRLVEVLAGEELLHDVGRPVLGHAEVVDRRDVRVVQVPGELRLAEEALLDLLLVALAGLDGDEALDERVAALVDGPETADADLLDDLVLADLRQHDGLETLPPFAIIRACREASDDRRRRARASSPPPVAARRRPRPSRLRRRARPRRRAPRTAPPRTDG